ncbi:MAG: hypothetical protein ABUL73_02355 [Alphaproteobacteria bacterium]
MEETTRPPPRLSVPPPDLPDGLSGQAESFDALDASVIHLGRLVIALGRTRMPDVQSTIGAGVIDEQGDGADWASWLCYTAPGSARIWLMSGAQGSGDFVGSVIAIADASAQPEEHCPALPAAYGPVYIEPDIWLGAQAPRINRLFGAGVDDNWRAIASRQHHRKDNLEYDESHFLALKFVNGRVVELRVSKQVTS